MNYEFILSHRDKQHDLDSSKAQPVIQKTSKHPKRRSVFLNGLVTG